MRGFKQWFRHHFDEIMTCAAVVLFLVTTPIIIYMSWDDFKEMAAKKEWVPMYNSEKYFDERITRIEQKIDRLLQVEKP
jgi:hypothetical protein